MSKVKGIVLCGGTGTRLRPITYYFQKTMIPIGLKQKPLLEYVVRLLKFHGVTDIAFLVNYKGEQIENYFDDGSRFKVKISYIYDESSLKGTAGSLLNAYGQKAISTSDTLLIYYGDILTNINIEEFLRYHKQNKASMTVALSSKFTVRVGLADMAPDGKIRGFVEKPALEKPVSIGIIASEGKNLKEMEKLKVETQELDLMGDIVPHVIKLGKPVYGFLSDMFWYDVGSMEAYEKLNPKLVDKLFAHLFQ